MAAIRYNSQSGQRHTSTSIKSLNRKKVWYISLIGATMLFACGFGFAAAQSWKLFTPDGAVTVELRSLLHNEESDSTLDIAALQNMLAEGEAATFYIKDQNRYISLANERLYTDYKPFSSQIGDRAPLNEIGDSFVFQSGLLFHDLNDEIPNVTSWKNSITIGEISYQLKVLGEAVGYQANYKNDYGKQVSLKVWFHVPDQTIFSTEMNDLEVEKIKIGVTEAFYLKGLHSSAQRLIWGENDNQSYYRLDDLSVEKLSREHLIDIASPLINYEKSN
ncbi:hypothetical protein DX130_16300 [Paenibacillus paeoniae]|uniref:Uncharacterized protein n=2 Tax=Paenibacillus paeoniae TaxID=2292705 RepID=A0A371PGU8_9BACL|nr:hypothetical protein DX130_16300 [Paenibacillus paeoniae]